MFVHYPNIVYLAILKGSFSVVHIITPPVIVLAGSLYLFIYMFRDMMTRMCWIRLSWYNKTDLLTWIHLIVFQPKLMYTERFILRQNERWFKGDEKGTTSHQWKVEKSNSIVRRKYTFYMVIFVDSTKSERRG